MKPNWNWDSFDYTLPEGKKAYFLSDLHLGAPYQAGSRENELRVVKFLEEIRKDAAVVYLLGDILDYWFEYRYVVPRGFVRFFGKLAELTDSGIRVVWIIGNHDIWIRDYIPNELGVEVYDGVLTQSICGKHFYLAHGDGLGKTPWSFRFIRSMFRNPVCQWLYSGIHPRWTIPFAYAWSGHSRANGEEPGQDTHPLLDHLKDYSLEVLSGHPEIDWFVYGHLHILYEEALSDRCRMIVLGEWLTLFSYAVFDGNSLKIGKYNA